MRVRSIFVVLAMAASVVVGTTVPAGAAVLMCNGLVVTHAGTPGPDILIGTSGPDVFFGGGGNDRIFTGGGNDTACGGPGNDFIKGQQGADNLFGGPGNDTLFGNAGFDMLLGGDGHDILWGGVGADGLWAGRGNDIVHAGHGNDFAVGGPGNDRLNGSTGADELFGGQGLDTLTGGRGFDELFGNGGNDILTGGPGTDFIQGDDGIDGCRVDNADSFFLCERGNILGGGGGLVNGAGSISVDLTPDFVLPSATAPLYILHVDANPLPGQVMTVSVFDAGQNLIFQGSGQDRLFANVLVPSNTEPATVTISGAAFWQAAFMKTSTILKSRTSHLDRASEIFAIPTAGNGQAQSATFNVLNESAQNSVFQVISVGSAGAVVEVNTTLTPGQTGLLTVPISAGAEYVAVLAGLVTWQFNLT